MHQPYVLPRRKRYAPNPHIVRLAWGGPDRDQALFNRTEPLVTAWAEEQGEELVFSPSESGERVRTEGDEIIVRAL